MTRAALLLLCGTVALMAPLIHAWGSNNNKDRVLLEKVSALTLEQGRMTTGRRSSPVQQLKCVGGSAGCSYGNQPRVVQCLNRGFDGYDVQWECKAELDSKYQFGKIQVSCEGYEYPDDPHILRGSCGLEYDLDLTQQGEQNQRGSDYHGNHHGNHHGDHYSGSPNYYRGGGWSWGGLIMLAIVGFIVYRVLRAYCSGANAQRYGTAGATSNTGSGSQSYSSPPPSNAGGLGGFWTGAATGGALGYLFGNRGGGYGYGGGYSRGYSTGYRSTGWGSRSGGFGGGGFGGGFGGGSSRSSGSSSSSRSSSGYGGTSRR